MFAHQRFSQSWSSGKRYLSESASSKTQYICECDSVKTVHTRRKCTQLNCNYCDFESICLFRDISDLSSSTSIESKKNLSHDNHVTFSRTSCALGPDISHIFDGGSNNEDQMWNFTTEKNTEILRITAASEFIDMWVLSEWCDGDANLIHLVLKTFCEQGRNHYIALMQAFDAMDLQVLSFHAVNSLLFKPDHP